MAPLLQDELAAGDAIAALRRYSLITLASGGSVSVHRLVQAVAQYFGRSGSYPAARDLFQLIMDTRREDNPYGVEHWDTLIARHELAHWTGRAGDAAGSRDQFAALLPVYERVLGPEHPDTQTARFNLASWTQRAGDGVSDPGQGMK